MFTANTQIWALTIRPEFGEGTLATFLAIKEADAKTHARAICKRLRVPKEKALLYRCNKKAGWRIK